jgi:Tat protein secretion system quality control protein TatD with DNase activity
MLDAHCHIGFLIDAAKRAYGEGGAVEGFCGCGTTELTAVDTPALQNACPATRNNLAEIIDYIETDMLGVLDMSTSHEDYTRSTVAFSTMPKIHSCAGLHPWVISKLVQQDHMRTAKLTSSAPATSPDAGEYPSLTQTLEQSLVYMRDTLLIGEIGLDFSPRVLAGSPDVSNASTSHNSDMSHIIKQAQIETLKHILNAAAPSGSRKIVSIHCVHAAHELIDLATPAIHRAPQSAFILHRFSGTSDKLVAAIRAGFWFSVGMQTLSTKRGQAYLRQIPTDRLLIETDLPQKEGDELTVVQYRAALDDAFAMARNILGSDIQTQIESNEMRLLKIVQQP